MNEKTGQRVIFNGVYKCKEHPENTKTFQKGTVFPPCGRGEDHGTTWVIVRKDTKQTTA